MVQLRPWPPFNLFCFQSITDGFEKDQRNGKVTHKIDPMDKAGRQVRLSDRRLSFP